MWTNIISGIAADAAFQKAASWVGLNRKYDAMSGAEKGIHADYAIRNHIAWSLGAGFIPLPVADALAVTAVQIDLIQQLSKIYCVDFKKSQVKAVLTSLTGSGMARAGASASKMIPGIGTMMGGVSMSVLSGASTYAVGEIFKRHYARGGSPSDVQPSRIRKMYNEQFEKGKEIARKIRRKKASAPDKTTQVEDWATQLEKLYELRESGLIDPTEYQDLKNRLIQRATA